MLVDGSSRVIQFLQNPLFDERLLSGRLLYHRISNHATIEERGESTFSEIAGTKSPSSLSIANFVAFQSLLQNCCEIHQHPHDAHEDEDEPFGIPLLAESPN